MARQRRQIRKGLETALKNAKARESRSGSGYWIGPHLWFLRHVMRDGDDDNHALTGLPYRRLIPRAARHHAYRVFRAVGVDLIFLEDGVGHRRFLRVLAQVFEFYDMFGERQLEALPAGARIHIPPDTPHAMRTGDAPLLAVYLWTGDRTQPARLLES